MGKGRLEAFSDGVIGVAITLLVLNLRFDDDPSTALTTQLGEHWPSFAAYVVSFFIIGVIWLNHHQLFQLVTAIDMRVMVYNLVMLLFVTAIPFTTATYANYVQAGGTSARTSVILYGLVMEGMAIGFMLILVRLVRAGLLDPKVSPSQVRSLLIRNGLRIVVYLVIIVVGAFNPLIMLILYVAIIGIYTVPTLRAFSADTPTSGRQS